MVFVPDKAKRASARMTNGLSGVPGPPAEGAPSPPIQNALEVNFPHIAEYAFLSDCENTCLVAPTGAVEWLCLPKPHDPSVFGTILDRAAGSFRFAPADSAVPANRRYVPGTMVLSTTWQTHTGWLAVRDFLVVAPWAGDSGRDENYARVPRDAEAKHMLVRTATCLKGTVEVQLNCEPSFDYGRVDAEWEFTTDDYYQVRTSNPDYVTLTLTGDLRMGIEGRAVRAQHRLAEGEQSYVALSWSDAEPPEPPESLEDVDRLLSETSRFWRGWLDTGRFPDHPWREVIQRSALTLKGLTFAPTGALLAAPTTSLPENLGGRRNWDYRYTWIRDSAFALWALHALGFETEADDFIEFLGDVLESGQRGAGLLMRRLQVLYPIDATSSVEESELDHLSGYAGSQPVRVGNAAFDQDQLDIFGAIVDCVYQHTRSRDSLSEQGWRIVVHVVEMTLKSWRDPDHGIWEVRSEPKQFTYSKMMCWVAVDRGARLAALRGETERAEEWWEISREIHADICENAVDQRGVFCQFYGSEELDASLLLLPLMLFLPPEDERIRATVLAIADELADGAFVYRYRAEKTDDGLGEPEGSFTVCSFWLISALVEIGELDRARTHCEKLIISASPLGLYGEEIDPRTARHLGNFPQALTHLALVNAVLRVIEAEQRANEANAGPAGSPSWWNAAGREDRTNIDPV